MAPIVDLPIVLVNHGGFVPLLFDVLEHLGVQTQFATCVCRGEAAPGGLKGHIVVDLRIPASTTHPDLPAFGKVEVETSVEACIQSVCRIALRHICRDAHAYLRDTPYRLLPRALDQTQRAHRQIVEADHAAYNAGDPCLEVMSHYVLHQDRFITEITGQNRAYRNLVFDAETKLGEQEQLTEKLFQEALQERTDFRENTRLHVELEKRSKAEIERLQKELAERDSRIDQLSRKKKELENTLDRLDEANERRDHRESRHSRRMEAQLKKNADLQNEITQLKKNAALNLRHLKESFKITAKI
jgi:predicted transcriptional regulator